METEPRHHCLIYEGPPSQKLPLIANILKRKLHEGYRCLYLNSAPMVAGMASTLAALGLDIAFEITKTNLILSSAPITTGDDFNCEEMLGKLEDSLDEALNAGYKGLWASGDMTWEFGSRKNFSKLLEYELKLEELFSKRKELHGVCQYHQDTLPQEAMRQSLLVHPNIVINETLTIVNPYYLRSSWPINQKNSNKLDKMITYLCSQNDGK